MLRMIFGEEPRKDEGLLKDAMNAMDKYLVYVRQEIAKDGDPNHRYRQLEIWTVGLKTSLDELEQSLYVADRFADRVTKAYQAEMSENELDDYYRHVYFYKNGFIRVFSILDKVGNVVDDALFLETEKIKQRFSFFTVLRNMQHKKVAQGLFNRLAVIKEEYRLPLQHLRKRRNTEIHHMNTEMQDDLWQRHRSLKEKLKLENIDEHMEDLRQGFVAVCRILVEIFAYLERERAVRPKPKRHLTRRRKST